MLDLHEINKHKLISKPPIGCILGSDADDGRYEYKNIIIGYIKDNPILIKTNLTQKEWDSLYK